MTYVTGYNGPIKNVPPLGKDNEDRACEYYIEDRKKHGEDMEPVACTSCLTNASLVHCQMVKYFVEMLIPVVMDVWRSSIHIVSMAM